MTIRTAAVEDAAELLEIYAPYVLDTAISFEYDVPTVEEFQKRMAGTLEKYPYLVAVENGHIVGYAYAGAFRSQKAYIHSVEVSIYVRMDARGKGIGRALYTKLEELLAGQNVYGAYACIAVPSAGHDRHLTDASELFHEKMGYKRIGTFENCGYKFDRWYTMIWMEKELKERISTSEAFIPFGGLP